ncbi:MAG: hypothetical protein ABT940_04320 [Alphaproteobacteria bacterium]
MLQADVRGSDPTAEFLRRLERLAAELAERTIGRARDRDGLSALAEGMAALTDLATVRLAAMLPPDLPLACGRGCAHCCRYGGVMVDPVSAMALAQSLVEQCGPAEMASILLHLANVSERSCALIDAYDGCIAYVTRPLTCRAINAYDDEACQKNGPPGASGNGGKGGYSVPPAIATAVVTGVAGTLATLGLICEPVELNTALRVLLSEPDATARWLSGEDVFGGLPPAGCL